MQRSIKLGHCVCDPRKDCPCEIFKDKNICLCAGERLDSPVEEVALTKIVEKPGCASKIDQAFLKEVLHGLPHSEDARVLVGVPAGDDAGVFSIDDNTCLVQTVDVFTPTVDDPYIFGQIAAANSVSDVYAMGGVPLTALSVLGFPVRKIPDSAMTEILRGGIDKMKEAGVSIIGGHSINDSELKAGFAVTGTIDKDKVLVNSGAKTGDVLILTKQLGTGIIAFASQIDKASKDEISAAAKSMTTLNKAAAETAVEFGIKACTDVTGFSLMGHLSEMALRSNVNVEVVWDDIPLLPGVLEHVSQGIFPGAIERNKESSSHAVIAGENVSEDMADMLYDAQTSGGLLLAVEQAKAPELLENLKSKGVEHATIIGCVTEEGTGKITINTTGTRSLTSAKKTSTAKVASNIESVTSMTQENCCCEEPAAEQEEACCCEGPVSKNEGQELSGVQDIEARYKSFMSKVGQPSGLDAFTKQAVNIALSVATKCGPCLDAHVKKARKMGFSEDEIDESAWMGIAFGGSPVMMFYKNNKPAVE